MRKTLATVLLGTTLIAAACAKRDRAELAASPEGAAGAALDRDTAARHADLKAEATPTAAMNAGSAAGAGTLADPADQPAPGPKGIAGKADPTGGESYRDYGRNPWT